MLAQLVFSIAILLGAETATPWEDAYLGPEATGPQVLGLWKFDTESGEDSTGKLKLGQLRGSSITPEGKFGGALESSGSGPNHDQPHGFQVPPHPRLSPAGPFTLEFWLKPKPEFAEESFIVLIDKKYAGHTDYQLSVGAADSSGRRSLQLALGFGTDSQSGHSESLQFPPDQWMHLAVTYDAHGSIQFYHNGNPIGGSVLPGRTAVAPGSLPLSIGDRLGSNYYGCPGYLDEVRLTEGIREFGALKLTAEIPRRTWVRFEPHAAWKLKVTNLRPVPLSEVTLSIAEGNGSKQVLNLSDLPAGESREFDRTFDTSLRPDVYSVQIEAQTRGDSPRQARKTVEWNLVPRPLPHRMPVVMWGVGGVEGVLAELPRLKQIGFTHCFGGDVDHGKIVAATKPGLVIDESRRPAVREMLDTALSNDFRVLASTWPGYFQPHLTKYLQLNREGKPYERQSLTPNAPPVLQVFERAGESIGLTYGDHPAFDGMCVNSEVRDESNVSFTEWDREAYRKVFNADLPDWVESKYGPKYSTLSDFPQDRVVEDDDPRLAFYRWWWSTGDGWNAAHSAVHRGLHRTGRPDLWTFYDPTVRVPPLWGSGGEVDVLSHWTYTDPDPLRMALSCDELLAMADGRQPAARTMKMTQLFWYRSSAAPSGTAPRDGQAPAEWVDRDPEAAYFSIHPLHLREAFWTKIARPIEGIMYHGWSSLVPTDGSHAYKYTHPELQHELTRLIQNVVRPLGPMLRQVPAVQSEVAFLESFTSSVFAGRGTWGYGGGWQADLYLALQHAQLQPQIVYEQRIQRDGLDPFRVLILADCDVLPRTVMNRILDFQKRGGIVIGDERLCPAIQPDIRLPVVVRVNDPARDKSHWLKIAEDLSRQLSGKYERAVSVDNPEIVPHRRKAGETDYLFLVNDAREAGEYVGQYGRVHESGRPSKGKVRIRTSATAVYDPVEHRSVAFHREGQDLVVPVELGPGTGRLLMFTPRPIESLELLGPEEISRGALWEGKLKLTDAAGQTLQAVLPVQLEILDPDGRLAEWSGFYGAVNGQLDLKLDIAKNDRKGIWEIRVHDLAGGLRFARFFRVID